MPSFTFSIPSLPKDVYTKMEAQRKLHGLTQRQTVILSLHLLDLACQASAPTAVEWFKAEVVKIKESHSA